MAYTVSILEVNPETFADIKARIDKIQETLPGQYEHMFHREDDGSVTGIDLTHIMIQPDHDAIPAIVTMLFRIMEHCGGIMSEPDSKDGKHPRARRLVLGFEEGTYGGQLHALLSNIRHSALMKRHDIKPVTPQELSEEAADSLKTALPRDPSELTKLDDWLDEEGIKDEVETKAKERVANPVEGLKNILRSMEQHDHSEVTLKLEDLQKLIHGGPETVFHVTYG